MRVNPAAILLLAGLLSCAARADDDPLSALASAAQRENAGKARASVSAPVTFRGGPQQGGREGYDYLRRHITLDSGSIVYQLKYFVELDAADREKCQPLTWATGGYSGLGISQPSMYNWYGNDFIDLLMNGRHLLASKIPEFKVVSAAGDRGIVDVIWSVSEGTARCRFMVLSGRDGLYLDITLEPKVDVDSFEVMLRCYPGGFAEPRSRWITTVRQEATFYKTVPLSGDESWVVYQDRNVGKSPCALVYLPDEVKSASVRVEQYPIYTTLSLPPDGRKERRLKLLLWEFPGKTNQETVSLLKEKADGLRQELAQLSFQP